MAARVFPVMDSHSDSDSESDVSITDSDVLHEIDNFIRRAEVQAYASVLRAFIYKANDIDQEKQDLIISLINEFKISKDEHNEVLAEIKDDEMIHLVREWKSFDNFLPEERIKSPYSIVSASQDQPLSSLPSEKSVQDPSVEPAKAASKDPLIGKTVFTRWSDGPFQDGNIIEYDPAKGKHKVLYNANTPNAFYNWIDVKKIFPENVDWEEIVRVPSTIHLDGQDSDSDESEEKVETGVQRNTIRTETRM